MLITVQFITNFRKQWTLKDFIALNPETHPEDVIRHI